jgi:hypothetical protein
VLAPQISAAAHPVLDAAMARLPSEGLLFPGLTLARMNDFIARRLANEEVPNKDAFAIGAHGVRVGADAEAKELGAPDDLLDILGWWSRQTRRMCDYYSSINVHALYALTRLYGQLDIVPLYPGVHEVRGAPGVARPRFNLGEVQAGARSPASPPPFHAHLVDDVDDEEGEAAGSPEAAVEGARYAAGAPVLTAGVGSTDGATCARCGSFIPEEEGCTCDVPRCRTRDFWVCSSCHPDFTEPLWCPAHDPASLPDDPSMASGRTPPSATATRARVRATQQALDLEAAGRRLLRQ